MEVISIHQIVSYNYKAKIITVTDRKTMMEDIKLAEFLDMLGQNGNFGAFPYYVVSFKAIPSTIRLSLPNEGSKELISSILENLELEKYAFQPIMKNWRTENTKDATLSDNFVSEYVFKSEAHRMLIHLIAQRKFTQVHFLYDLNNAETEAWILGRHHNLRTIYGDEKKPGFGFGVI